MKQKAKKYIDALSIATYECQQTLSKHPENVVKYNEMHARLKFLKEIVRIRYRCKISSAELGRRMGVHRTAVSRLERAILSEQHSPSINTLRKFAGALGCRLEINFVQKYSRVK